jgi:hypothetical protein
MTVDFNAENAAGVYGGSQGQVSGAREGISGVDGSGLNDPALTDALDEHNEKTEGQMTDTEDDLGKGKKATTDLDATDKKNASKIGGLGGPDALKNALGGGSPQSAPAGGSPAPTPSSSGGGSPMPSMPQMPMQAPQSPMTTLSPDQLTRLLQGAGITPEDITNAKAGTSGGKAKGSAPIGTDGVGLKKTGHGPLTKSQMHAVIDKALDNNGVTRDPKVRAKWHNMLMFMAEKESSFNPDSVNVSDSNAVGPRQVDGAPAKSSRGLWQTIPPTFAANHVGGTSNNIYDPVANGSAAIHYIMSRYHVDPSGGASLESFYQRRKAGGYTGY